MTSSTEQDPSREAVVAANVQTLRKRLGLSQTELGTRAGFGEMAVGNIENGKRRVNVDDLYALADALGATVQHLLNPDCSPFPAEQQYEVWLDGDVAQLVTADTVEPDGEGWLNFYLRGDRVFFAAVPRVLCVVIGVTR
ncbi:helix-turn-helix transcriptional regulator [Streptomyces sp. NPDC051642]|uniref:helix-turn-helix domain-containing protein n=1 Tax=Streptomyces sp. NPDC051642 TaxID=3154646 RepID=UPI00343621E7